MSRLAGPDRPPGPLGLRQHLPRLSTQLNTPPSPCKGPLTPPASPGPEARQGGRSFQGLGRKRLVVFLEPPTERHGKRRILPRLWDGTELTSVSRRLRGEGQQMAHSAGQGKGGTHRDSPRDCAGHRTGWLVSARRTSEKPAAGNTGPPGAGRPAGTPESPGRQHRWMEHSPDTELLVEARG